MRYVLERVEFDPDFVPAGRTGSPRVRFEWREIASSDDMEMLKQISENMDRIIDKKTGNVVHESIKYSLLLNKVFRDVV